MKLSTRMSRWGKVLVSRLLWGVALVVVFALGYVVRGGGMGPGMDMHAMPTGDGDAAVGVGQSEIWTCSMHPQVQLSKPGSCPICGMDLIIAAGGEVARGDNDRRLTTSAAAAALMQIQTSAVERRFVTAEIRMVGKVDYDETRLASISAWVPGRIDRMYVDYTGIKVNEGDHLVDLYSPEVLTAQEELRRAAKTVKNLQAEASEMVRSSTELTLNAVREKLRRWGLTEGQIARAEGDGVLSDNITIYATLGGTVIKRSGQEGMYVDIGTPIYEIADLTHVWVQLEAYESDLAWLHYGQSVMFKAQAHPGETFTGIISFIDPLLDEKTRTVRVRVNVPNPDGKLKPGMFVRAGAQAQIASAERAMDPGFAGKWIAPMHPEIVKDGPGTCDICKMALVRAEDLGFVSLDPGDAQAPLVIPTSAALITGERAVVYVQVPNTAEPTFEGREVVLGPRAGDYFLVKSGLVEGELVVTNGNFKIDSALQIIAKPSMMSAEGGVGGGGMTMMEGSSMKGVAQ